MASIVIAGDTSGSVTLQAPAVAGSTVLNLPSTSGTIQTSGAGYTTNGVAYATSTSALSTGSALTFDGTKYQLGVSGSTGATLASTFAIEDYSSTDQYRLTMNWVGSGKLGIGASTSSGIIFGTATGTSGAVTSQWMCLNSTGLGIGTSSPSTKLYVLSSAATPTVIETSGGTAAYLQLKNTGGSAYIGSVSDALAFYTSGSGTERMRLDSAGNLGLGTSSPSQKLDATVSSSTEGSGLAITNSLSGGYGSGITFYSVRSDTSAKVAAAQIKIEGGSSWNSNATTSSAMVFSTINANTFAERARFDPSGNLLVGTTSNTQGSSNGVKIQNYGAVWVVNNSSTGGGDGFSYYSTSASAYRFYVTGGGNINATNTTITAISDQRLKENIVDLDVGLDAIMALKPRKFDWKAGKGKDIKGDRGWIAQEFETVFPDLIDTWKDPAPEGEEPYKSVRADLIPILVKAIQEQQTLINTLTDRISVLENK